MVVLGCIARELALYRQPTDKYMHNELISNLTNNLLSTVISLFFVAIISMVIGYRIIARRLKNNGMKKGDALAIGQAVTVFIFVTIGYLYLKLFVLS
jgi:hypothetical protein